MNNNPPENWIINPHHIFKGTYFTYIKPHKQRNYKQKRVNGIFLDLTKNTA